MKDLVCNLVQILNCDLKKLIVHAAAAAGDHVSRPGSWERQLRHLHLYIHFRNFRHFRHLRHFRQQIIFILGLMARVMGKVRHNMSFVIFNQSTKMLENHITICLGCYI